MVKEIVCIKQKKTSLTVTNSKISALLRSNTQKTGIRLYDSGCLGIAGAIGAYDEKELYARARHMLKFKLPYDCVPTKDAKRSLDLSTGLVATEAQFVDMSKAILEKMREKYPKFMFVHKINLMETEESLANALGTELVQKDRYVDFQLYYKYRDSKNLMDGGGRALTRELDFDLIFNALTETCDAYEEKADFSQDFETIPVVMLGPHIEFGMKFITDLKGDAFASGASLFSGKMGEKLFDDKLSLIINRNAEKSFCRFFDGEGVTLEGDRFALIKDGVLCAPYASKRMAKQYDLPISGVASLEYDSAPDASPMAAASVMEIAQSNKTIKELLGGQKAIYAMEAGGGDFTPQGEYASPIQVAYLFDGEKFLGRLPQLSMRSHISDMFGKDFIGASIDGPYRGCPSNYLAINMNVRKSDTWM